MKTVIVFDGDCGICSFLVTSTFHLSNFFNVRNIYYTPLTSELEYFAKCVNYGNEIQISNGHHALDVTRILVAASEQLNRQ